MMTKPTHTFFQIFLIGSSIFLGSLSIGCTPQARVEVAAPEPITINLNVKIDHEIRVKVDKELDSVFSEDSELF